eukprot:5333200-Pyramimonas_sp.AAC.1
MVALPSTEAWMSRPEFAAQSRAASSTKETSVTSIGVSVRVASTCRSPGGICRAHPCSQSSLCRSLGRLANPRLYTRSAKPLPGLVPRQLPAVLRAPCVMKNVWQRASAMA